MYEKGDQIGEIPCMKEKKRKWIDKAFGRVWWYGAIVDKHIGLSQIKHLNLKAITLHFPMKTTAHMILIGDIERSQTPLD